MFSCTPGEYADLIVYNGEVYTVDSTNKWVGAFAVKNGRILELSSDLGGLEHLKNDQTNLVNAEGNFVMPGFIEGHGHFLGLGKSLVNVNLLDAKSWEEVVSRVEARVRDLEPGDWLEGRGWHQEKWDSIPYPNVHGYPFHDQLSAVTPNNPVVLFHASGHSLFANEMAMSKLKLSSENDQPIGGEIVKDSNGDPIGVFEERAMDPIVEGYQSYIAELPVEKVEASWKQAIRKAQKECLRKGVTSFQDAGSKLKDILRYRELSEQDSLDVRLWVMARDSFGALEKDIDKMQYRNPANFYFTCNAIKSEVDGALGAFGAWLLKPYSDKPGFYGQNTTDIYDVKKIADLALKNEMQLCVHAIGDRANRVVLDIYEGVLGEESREKRWRIEHAQHLDTMDIPRFAENGIIASMQGVHCTSDAPFVEKRLGKERAQLGAYAWRSLLDEGVVVANGTDAPVEDVDPLKSFYASVTRTRSDNGFVFYRDQSMSREEAVYSYTLGNAFASFQEDYKGMIKEGYLADFVILSENLVNCSDEKILDTKVLSTFVDGQLKYNR